MSNIKPLVSVIMPAYNGADFIKKAIDSVISQSFPDFELIIINDSSTDETEKIVKGYRDKRIIYLKNKTNQGVPGARNKGIKACRGKYIAYCDQDDIYYRDHLKKFLSIFDTHPETGLVYANYLKCQAGSNPIILPEKEIPRERKLKYFIGPPVNVMHKIECIRRVGGFDESSVITRYSCEDRDLWLRISEHFNFYHIDQILSEVTIHGKNRSLDVDFHKSWRYMIFKRWRSRNTFAKRVHFINNCGMDAVDILQRCGYFKDAFILARKFCGVIKNTHSLACLGLCNMAKGNFRAASVAFEQSLFPKVSVIMPTYNRAKIIKKAIKSVLMQTLENFELIVINDGSTDDTKETVSKFKDRRIIYLEKENGGPASARNLGIKHAKGEHIAYLDDDDIYYPCHLERLSRLLDAHPGIGMVYSHCLVRYPDGKISHRETNFSKRNLETLGIYFPSCAVMHRKSCLKKVGIFDEKLLFAQDFDMWLKITDFYKAMRLPLLTGERIFHGNNRSLVSLDNKINISCERLIQKRLNKAEKEGSLNNYISGCSMGVVKRLLLYKSFKKAFLLAHKFHDKIKNYQTIASLGLCNLSEGNFHKAAGRLQKALKLIAEPVGPRNKQFKEDICTIRLFLAKAYLNLNKVDLAIKLYQKVLRIDRDNIDARYSLSRCYIAKAKYAKVLSLLKGIPGAYAKRLRGAVYFNQGRYSKAENMFKDALKYNPDSALDRHNLIVSSTKKNRAKNKTICS